MLCLNPPNKGFKWFTNIIDSPLRLWTIQWYIIEKYMNAKLKWHLQSTLGNIKWGNSLKNMLIFDRVQRNDN